jgi:hypothetical protein
VTRASGARLGWAHPFAPAPVLAVLGALVFAGWLQWTSAGGTSWLPVLVAWVVLALCAGYSISGSV